MFPQSNRGTVIQCYRANEYHGQKKAKKVQKDLLRKTAGISPKAYDHASAYTVPLEPFEDTNGQYQISMKKKKKKVIFNLCECNDYETEKYRKPKTWDSITNYYGNADTTEIWADLENQTRKQKRHKKEHADVETNGELVDNTKYTKKHTRRSKSHKKRGHRFISRIPNENEEKHYEAPGDDKSKFQKSLKSKDVTFFRQKCPDDECADEARRNKKYSCDCNMKTKPEPQLTTKVLARSVLSLNSMAKIKDKLLCICHRYSQKVINLKPTDMDVVNKDQDKISRKISKRTKKGNETILKKEHEGEQTGEPFFEIQVNPRDMCVLNPTEIKQSILKYGRPEKNVPKCICPSRGRLRPGEVCKSGPCKKAYKNKQVNFNCWCEKKLAECRDSTCDAVGIRDKRMKHKRRHIRIPRVNKPLLEVQLDIDKMCVVNPKEIQEKIISNISVDEVCSSGVCREAALKSKTPYFCKCVRKKLESDITECSEDTCGGTTEKKKSKFSLLCTRIRSKSENWIIRNRNDPQKRIKRRSVYDISPNKLRKGKISASPDNLRKDYIEPKQNKLSKLNIMQKDINENNIKNNSNDLGAGKLVKIQEELNLYNPPKVKHVGVSNEKKYKTNDVTCVCAHQCECDKDRMDDTKLEMKNTKYKEQQQRNKSAQKQRNKRLNEIDMKRRVKLDKKGEKKSAKERLKEIKLMQKKMQEEPLDTNVCTAFLLGVLKIGFKTIFFIFRMLYYVIKHPRKSYYYVMDRLRDPEATFFKFRQWIRDAVMIKKLEIANTVRGSDTLTILADHFLDTPVYQTLADKGKTKEDQVAFENKNKARKRRIRKREQQAIHSCRHMLLTTLRHTPCLWVYHICPNFYPQCLSLLSFLRSFSHILMFLVAFTCWTPCILSFELCRAFLCCFMCTG